MKKFLAKLHLWLAVPFGLVIMILCLTGAILVFETELKELFQPSLYKASQKSGDALALEELLDRVKVQLPDTVSLSSIQITSSPENNYRLGVAGQGRTSILVDPYTGEVKGSVRPYAKGEFFSVVRRLHRWFLFEMKREGISVGKLITGTSTLIFGLILISGIILWIPRTVAGLKRRLTIKTGAGRFRFWYDFHLAGGQIASLLLLVMVLTGLTWSFSWYRNGFYKVFGVEIKQNAGGHGNAPAPSSGASDDVPTREYDDSNRLLKLNPGYIIQDTNGKSAVNCENQSPTDIKSEILEGLKQNTEGITERADRRQSGKKMNREPEIHERDGDTTERGREQKTPLPANEGEPLYPQPTAGNLSERSDGSAHTGRSGRSNVESGESIPVDYNVWETVANNLKEFYPRYKYVSIQNGTASVSVNRYGNTRASDSYTFDPETGEITGIKYYHDQPKSAKIRGWIYSVHVGSWGGIFTRILYFLTCIVGTILPLTGYYIWLKKRWKKWKKTRQLSKI